MKIFLSAVSAQFKACRDALASDMRAIGCEVKVQEDFQQGPRTLLERLEEYVAGCDRVIALIGDAYGAPAAGFTTPDVESPRSYTQWEYRIASGERLTGAQAAPIDLNVYFATGRFLAANPVSQADDAAGNQRRFVETIRSSGKHRGDFDDLNGLCRIALRDIWNIQKVPDVPEDQATLAALARLRVALADGVSPVISDDERIAIRIHVARTPAEYRLARWAYWSQGKYALDKRFTPLTLLLDQGPQADGPRWQAQRPASFSDLRDVLAATSDSALVVLGPPGSGKSTLLGRLELDLAAEALRADATETRLTFFVPLNSYRAARIGDPLPAPREWLAREWARLNPYLPGLDELLLRGRMVLLLDAINEIPHRGPDDYLERIGEWQQCIAELVRSAPAARVVFSCRTLNLSAPLSSAELKVPHVRIERLRDEQVREFLTLYDAERGEVIWQKLLGTPQLDLFRSPFFLRLLLAWTARDGEVPSGRAALFTGFVREALLREIESRNRLFGPGALVDPTDHGQIVRGEWPNGVALAGRSPIFGTLAAFARGLQERTKPGEQSQLRVRRDEALALLGGERAEDLLAAGVALQLLEVQWDDVVFTHQLWQEYFAGRALAAAPAPELARTPWRGSEVIPSLAATLKTLGDSDPLPPANPTGWEETMVLAAALAREPETFVSALIEPNLPLAGRCAAQPDVAISDALRARIRQALLARSRDPKADLRARIVAARALGELGDPRFERRRGPHGEYLLPSVVPIRAGAYPLGTDDSAEKDERPADRVTLAAFAIARFPVTNAEWGLFMAAGGYEDERWWESEAAHRWRRGEETAEGPRADSRELRTRWQNNPAEIEELLRDRRITSEQAKNFEAIRQMSDAGFEALLDDWHPAGRQDRPAYWDDPAFNHPAYPVVGVCWYEARAYCAWLSAQTGQSWRLPTEAEWEAAARGSQGRRYAWRAWRWPWTDGFDPARCNAFETHIRATTPIGVFPSGDTPEGVSDLTGNVWEWTGTLYRGYRYDSADGREDAAADGRRAVRGGSWGDGRRSARAAYRSRDVPGYRSNGLGFRVVCASPII